MRRINAVLTALIMVLFLAHGVMGGFQLAGVGTTALKNTAWVAAALTGIHTLIGIKLTADTLSAQRRSGAAYFKENRLFWARRISGFAVMAFLLVHMFSFGYSASNGAYRLRPFTAVSLVMQVFLVLSIAVHVISNVRPALIAFGIRRFRDISPDILIVLSILLLLMAASFAVYYIRWQAV